MTWQPELVELRRGEALAEELGGAQKVERQHQFGKHVRQRIDQVVDDGSFWELGKTAGVAEYDDSNLIAFTVELRLWPLRTASMTRTFMPALMPAIVQAWRK